MLGCLPSSVEIAERKIIAGELDKVRDKAAESLSDGQRHGNVNGVYIVNSRGTPTRDDDLSLFTRGPVYFQDEKNQIWTREAVELIDQQSKPKPTIVKATGMDVYLVAGEPAGKENPPRCGFSWAMGQGPIGGAFCFRPSVLWTWCRGWRWSPTGWPMPRPARKER